MHTHLITYENHHHIRQIQYVLFIIWSYQHLHHYHHKVDFDHDFRFTNSWSDKSFISSNCPLARSASQFQVAGIASSIRPKLEVRIAHIRLQQVRSNWFSRFLVQIRQNRSDSCTGYPVWETGFKNAYQSSKYAHILLDFFQDGLLSLLLSKT